MPTSNPLNYTEIPFNNLLSAQGTSGTNDVSESDSKVFAELDEATKALICDTASRFYVAGLREGFRLDEVEAARRAWSRAFVLAATRPW